MSLSNTFEKYGGTDRNCAEILQGSYYVESSRQSEPASVVRGYNGRRPFHNDIRVDGQQDHKRVCPGTSERESF
jgi:hypothetical protein